MATSWKTTRVRIERPVGISPADFLAIIWSWLHHQCILLADFSTKTEAFEAVFDNPRDAQLFKRRFAVRRTTDIADRNASHWPSNAPSAPAATPIAGGLVPIGDAA
jgi:hypothetical protein